MLYFCDKTGGWSAVEALYGFTYLVGDGFAEPLGYADSSSALVLMS